MRLLPIAGLLAALFLTSTCDSNDGSRSGTPSGQAEAEASTVSTIGPRSFAMGFSDVPAESSPAGLEDAYRRAGDHGELVLIQRAPAWSSFLAGSEPEQALIDTMRNELALAELYELEFYLAIDPTNPIDRGEMAALPPALEGRDFTDQAVRDAYIGYVRYIAENYQPSYLALAVEVNLLFDQDAANYDAFLDVYTEAYAVAEEASPDSAVFVTFQYEELLGLPPLGGDHDPHWDLIDDFAPLDILALSSYPGFSFDEADSIPAGYYDQTREHSDLPIAIAEMGFSSNSGENVAGGEDSQRLFLERVLVSASALDMAFVVWFLSVDPSYDLAVPFDELATVGLVTADGTEKPAWVAWATHAARPYDGAVIEESTEDVQPESDISSPTPGTSGSMPTP